MVLDDSVLAPDTVVPPFAVFGGKPATYIGELPESTPVVHKEKTVWYYKKFLGVTNKP